MRTLDHAVFAARLGREVPGIRSPFKKICFRIGNLIPDYSYHTYSKSIGHGFRTARKKLVLAWQSRHFHGETAVFYFRLGVAAHYICDSFTYPHNSVFKGGLKEHIAYENAMHKSFSEPYERGEAVIFSTPEDCMRYLEKCHRSYLAQPEKSPVSDIGWILGACRTAVLSSFSIPRELGINIKRILLPTK